MRVDNIFVVAVVVAIAVFGLYFGMQQITGNVTASLDSNSIKGNLELCVIDTVGKTGSLACPKDGMVANYYIYKNTDSPFSPLAVPVAQGQTDSNGKAFVELNAGTYNMKVEPLPTNTYRTASFTLSSAPVIVVGQTTKKSVLAKLKTINIKVNIFDEAGKGVSGVSVTLTDQVTQKFTKLTTNTYGIVNFTTVGGKLIDKTHEMTLEASKSGYDLYSIVLPANMPISSDPTYGPYSITHTLKLVMKKSIDLTKTTVNVTVTDGLGNPQSGLKVYALNSCFEGQGLGQFSQCGNKWNYSSFFSDVTNASGIAQLTLTYNSPTAEDQDFMLFVANGLGDSNVFIRKSISAGKTVNIPIKVMTGEATLDINAVNVNWQPAGAALSVNGSLNVYLYGGSAVLKDQYLSYCTVDQYAGQGFCKVPTYNDTTQRTVTLGGKLYYNNWQISEPVTKSVNIVNGGTTNVYLQMTK